MNSQEYLQQLLAGQDLKKDEEDGLRSLRAQVEVVVGRLSGNPRFYYAGSYGKKTIIREHYDLDVVAYWPHDCGFTLKDIYNAVGDELKKEWRYVNPKTVAWELPFQNGFHLDVVPGRAIDSTFKEANLYRRDKDSLLKTSIKIHIDAVRNSDRRDAIRLMKLWKARKSVSFKTFILELMTIEGCKGKSLTDLEPQLVAALQHIRANIMTARVVDPANTNNVISDDIGYGEKEAIKTAAQAALDAQYWSEVFRA